jgi:two-component system, NarL family, nitrate/nitrite response regulator NarL
MIELNCARQKFPAADVSALVVSDVALFREGIGAGLKRIGEIDVTASLCPADAVAFLAASRVAIVVLDTSRRRALAHASAIKQSCPEVHIIAFGIGATEDILAGAESGISAFVDESGSIEDINDAALRALQGQSYCSPELTARLLSHISTLARGRQDRSATLLTERENEIASHVREGLSNKEIALRLRISPATVKNHVHNILEKLELSSRNAIGNHIDRSTRGEFIQMIAG